MISLNPVRGNTHIVVEERDDGARAGRRRHCGRDRYALLTLDDRAQAFRVLCLQAVEDLRCAVGGVVVDDDDFVLAGIGGLVKHAARGRTPGRPLCYKSARRRILQVSRSCVHLALELWLSRRRSDLVALVDVLSPRETGEIDARQLALEPLRG